METLALTFASVTLMVLGGLVAGFTIGLVAGCAWLSLRNRLARHG